MKKIQFLIIVSNTSRALVYLNAIKRNKLIPNEIIYLDDKKKNVIKKKLNKLFIQFPKIKVKKFIGSKINKKISDYLLKKKEKYVVYCGYPGVLVKNHVINKKFFINNHPGKLPKFKGSNTIFYSLLGEKTIFCSTIILNYNIDEGDILFEKKYEIPKKISDIDSNYDNLIRSKNLIYVLKNFHKLKRKRQTKNYKIPFFVMHPLLRSKVLMKKNK